MNRSQAKSINFTFGIFFLNSSVVAFDRVITFYIYKKFFLFPLFDIIKRENLFGHRIKNN